MKVFTEFGGRREIRPNDRLFEAMKVFTEFGGRREIKAHGMRKNAKSKRDHIRDFSILIAFNLFFFFSIQALADPSPVRESSVLAGNWSVVAVSNQQGELPPEWYRGIPTQSFSGRVARPGSAGKRR